METEKATDLIRRLLALGESRNPNEAKLALAKAAQIAAKHSLDLATIAANRKQDRIIHEAWTTTELFHEYYKMTLRLCAALFNVSAATRLNRERMEFEVVFVGQPHNIASAKIAMEFIKAAMLRDFKAWREAEVIRLRAFGRRITVDAENSYMVGWGVGVLEEHDVQMKDDPLLGDAKYALVIAEDQKARDAYTQEHVPGTEEELPEPERNDQTVRAFATGNAQGRKAKIRPVLEG